MTRDFSNVTAHIERTAAERPPDAANLRTVQAQIDAIARGDFDAVLNGAAPSVTLEIFAPPEFPWIRQATGERELRAALAQNFGSVDDQRPTIRDIFAEGDTVILFGREQGILRTSGTPYDVEFVERFTFDAEGRLQAVRIVAAHAAK